MSRCHPYSAAIAADNTFQVPLRKGRDAAVTNTSREVPTSREIIPTTNPPSHTKRRSSNVYEGADSAGTTIKGDGVGNATGTLIEAGSIADCVVCQAGPTTAMTGVSAATITATDRSRWRIAADCFRKNSVATSATSSTIDTFAVTSRRKVIFGLPFWPYPPDRQSDRVLPVITAILQRPAAQQRLFQSIHRRTYRSDA